MLMKGIIFVTNRSRTVHDCICKRLKAGFGFFHIREVKVHFFVFKNGRAGRFVA